MLQYIRDNIRIGLHLAIVSLGSVSLIFLLFGVSQNRHYHSPIQSGQIEDTEVVSNLILAAVDSTQEDLSQALDTYHGLDYGIVLFSKETNQILHYRGPIGCCNLTSETISQLLTEEPFDFEGKPSGEAYIRDVDLDIVYSLQPIPSDPNQYLLIFTPASNLNNALQSVYRETLIVFLSLLGILLCANLFVGNNISRLLSEIELLAKYLSKGEYGYRLSIPNQNNIKRFAQVVNELADKIELDDRTRKTFIRKISHELRTPLAIIKGASINALEHADLNSREVILVVEQQADYLSRLVNDLFEITFFELSEFDISTELWDLNELISQEISSYNTMLQSRDIELDWMPIDEPVYVEVDPERMSQVLKILIDNAVKYGVVSAPPSLGRFEPNAKISVNLNAGNKRAVISIADNGPGIPTDQLDKIFETYHQTNDQNIGSGIGLSVARKIIRKHGGKLWANSVAGSGAEFCILLNIHEFDD